MAPFSSGASLAGEMEGEILARAFGEPPLAVRALFHVISVSWGFLRGASILFQNSLDLFDPPTSSPPDQIWSLHAANFLAINDYNKELDLPFWKRENRDEGFLNCSLIQMERAMGRFAGFMEARHRLARSLIKLIFFSDLIVDFSMSYHFV
ncbi:hypothetical protein KSP40_PGU002254 [Platanthera guangdongensis]|uniref:Uncharacterized protein n=1 Tax=Platanthera guangdongensis TaxID=2320717 RepID=A0ABR2M695_9ASPA